MRQPVKYHKGGFPPPPLDWPQLIPLIGPASAAVARYDGLLSAIPNANVLLAPLMTQEAVLSSRIEGTQATMGEVFEFEAEADQANPIADEKRDDIEEILNYRRAMRRAEELLKALPLCQRVIRETHTVLLNGVRGHNKAPGEYRRIPNWIGPAGCPMEEASYIPISAADLPDAMSSWEAYIHSDAPDRLVQLAILHAEFEALHPFLDGNGRLGRMLVPLFMAKHNLLSAPMFYISAFFERNRAEYYERLLAVSRDGDWTGWVAFFLRSVIEQARENQDKAEGIKNLYNVTLHRITDLTRSKYAVHVTDFLFQLPVFSASAFYRNPELTQASGHRILNILQKNDFFREVRPGSGSRPAVLAFRELLNLAEGRDVL